MQESSQNRIYWSCRRGMLELDLILIPFYKNCYATLNEDLKKQFQLLLEATDTDLFVWLTGREEPTEPAIESIISLIRNYAINPSRHRAV